jgi:hypothetical protein
MAADLIHDRGRGPEVVGTRITVYDLLPYFLDPTATEEYVCRVNGLAPEQVAAARAYVLNNPDPILSRHMEIEARMAVGNPPEVIERMKKTHATFLIFKEWLVERKKAEAQAIADEAATEPSRTRMESFREWIMKRESRQEQGL